MTICTARCRFRFLLGATVTAFVANWVWEMAQMQAYAQMRNRNWLETIPVCTVATLGDVAATLAIYALGALAAGRPDWGVLPRWNAFIFAAVLGGILALAIEWRALAFDRWSYSHLMPIVPIVSIGLWPLLQLPLLVPAALWFGSWWTRRSLANADG